MILLTTFGIGLVGLLMLCWIGYAPARWLLPAGLRPWRWLLAPWFGYAAFVVVAQFAMQLNINGWQIALGMLILATAINGVAWWTGRGARRQGSDAGDTMGDAAGEAAIPAEEGRTWALIAALTLISFVLAVLPLLIYGYSTVIGENWDAEIYLALGEYLKTVPQSALGAETPNPLLSILLVPPYSLRTHGFSYFHAGLSALLGAQSLDTLHPTLALLRALEVPAAFVFLRGLWGWRSSPALLAAGLLALNPFLLWIAFNTFGMQVPALGLLPAAAAVTLCFLREVATVRNKGWNWTGGIGGAGLLIAGLAITYHPALTALAAICGLGWLALLVEQPARWARLMLAGAAIALAAVALSAVAQWLSLQGFIAQYAEQVGGLGLTGFTLPGDALGFSLSFRTLLEAGPGQPLLSLAAQGYRLLALAAMLCAAALGAWWAFSELRARSAGWMLRLATAGASVLYLLVFFWPLRYPYGWFKAQSFVAFLLVAAAVGGAWRLLGGKLNVDEAAPQAAPGRPMPLLRLAGAGLSALPLLALLATLTLTIWQYRSPIRFDQEMLGAGAVRQWVQPGDPVLLGNSRSMPGRLFNGLAAYFLRGADLYGTFNTANAAWDRARPDGAYRWALLNHADLPELYGYGAQDRVWSNDLLALYRRPTGLLYHADWDRDGDYPRVRPLLDMTLLVAGSGVELAGEDGTAPPAAAGQPSPRKLTLALAAYETQTLTLRVDSPSLAASTSPTTTTVSLAPGLQTVSITVTSPSTITVAADPEAHLSTEAFLRWLTLERAERRAPLPATVPATIVPGTVMLSVNTSTAQPNIRTSLQLAETTGDRPRIDRIVLDIWSRTGHTHPDDHFGYWTFRRTGDQMTFGMNATNGAGFATRGAQLIPDEQWSAPPKSGSYTASLSIYAGDRLLETVTDIYTFDLDVGPLSNTLLSGRVVAVSNLRPRRFPLLFY